MRRLLARTDEALHLISRKCGSSIRINAFIDEGEAIQEILLRLVEPITLLKLSPTRGLPLWEEADGSTNPLAPPIPEFEFDQWRAAKAGSKARYYPNEQREDGGLISFLLPVKSWVN